VLGGLTTGAVIAAELIKVLTGIFDPPPQHPAIPWTFVGTVLLVVLAAAVAAAAGSARWTARFDASRLRDL
jgi:putative ABC transport system permease protein